MVNPILGIDISKKAFDVALLRGDKDRTTLLPLSVRDELKVHLQRVKHLFERDVAEGTDNVWLPALWRRNIRMPRNRGSGNICFPPNRSPAIRKAEKFAVIT